MAMNIQHSSNTVHHINVNRKSQIVHSKSSLILLIFLLSGFAGQAQDTLRTPFQWGARWHTGFIIPHSREIVNVSGSNPFGLEISAQWVLNSPEHTRKLGLISKRGFAFHYINFDNPQVLGHTVAIVPFVEPLIRPWKPLYASVRLGLGPAWLNKLYHPDNNPTNLFFSYPISLWAMLNAHLHYKINTQWELSAGLNYNHISNGGMKNPNKGMNFPTYNAGISYSFQPIQMTRPEKNRDWKNQPRHYAYASLIGTLKNMDATPEYPELTRCWSYGIQVMGARRVGRFSALALGTEWIHDGFAEETLRRLNLDKSAWKGGGLLGHELLVGRVSFSTLLGVYLFNPSGDRDPVYQRYALQYRFGRRFVLGSSLKAHRHVADVFDLRLGWQLGK